MWSLQAWNSKSSNWLSLPIRVYAMHSKRGHRIVRSAHFIRTRSNYSSWLRADFCMLKKKFGDCISTYCALRPSQSWARSAAAAAVRLSVQFSSELGHGAESWGSPPAQCSCLVDIRNISIDSIRAEWYLVGTDTLTIYVCQVIGLIYYFIRTLRLIYWIQMDFVQQDLV